MEPSIPPLAAVSWLDSYGWLVVVIPAVVVLVTTLVVRQRRRPPPLQPEEIVERRDRLRAAGASGPVAEALASDDRILAIKRYREEQGVGLREAKAAVDRMALARRMEALSAVVASPAIADALARGDRILAIKRYREEQGVGLREAKEAVDQLALAPRRAALTAAGATPAVADALARGNQILAIKLYRQEHGVGLREAKAAIERLAQTPQTPAPPTNLGG